MRLKHIAVWGLVLLCMSVGIAMAVDGTACLIRPSDLTWDACAEGGTKSVQILSDAEWRVDECPEWIELYIPEKVLNVDGSGKWTLQPAAVNTAQEGYIYYPGGTSLIMKTQQNDSQAARSGAVVFALPDGSTAAITVTQGRYVEGLDVQIVRPCADAVDFVMAGYAVDVEIQLSDAVKGRVRITDSEGSVLYEAEFTDEKYAFEYVFEPGCYVICAEASAEEKIEPGCAGYTFRMATITASEVEMIEEAGVTRNYLEYVKIREGKRTKPYQDVGGYWTIGYGHLINAELARKYASGWSDKLCEEQLIYDLKFHADLMRERLGEELYSMLTPYQFDALVSMEFNGCGRAVESQYRLGRCLQKLDTVKDWELVNGFVTWHGIHNGTIDLLPLYCRRMEEARMFLYGDYSIKEWPIPWWLNIEYNGRGTSIHEVPSGNDWQKDIIPTMELSTSLIEADGSGAAEYIIVQSGRYWSAQVEEECPWIEVSNQWQGKKTIVRISVHENDGDARHGVIRFTAGPTVRTLHIHQKGAGAQESVVPEEAP